MYFPFPCILVASSSIREVVATTRADCRGAGVRECGADHCRPLRVIFGEKRGIHETDSLGRCVPLFLSREEEFSAEPGKGESGTYSLWPSYYSACAFFTSESWNLDDPKR